MDKIKWTVKENDKEWWGTVEGQAPDLFKVVKVENGYRWVSTNGMTLYPTLRGAKIAAARKWNKSTPAIVAPVAIVGEVMPESAAL